MRAAGGTCQIQPAHARSRCVFALQAASSGNQSLCAPALQGQIVSSNGPDLAAIAQYGLDKDVKQFALGNWVMNVQLLASAVQAKHSAFGSFAEGFEISHGVSFTVH